MTGLRLPAGPRSVVPLVVAAVVVLALAGVGVFALGRDGGGGSCVRTATRRTRTGSSASVSTFPWSVTLPSNVSMSYCFERVPMRTMMSSLPVRSTVIGR